MSNLTFSFLLPVIIVLITFSFTAFATWSGDRTQERKAFYRNELLKKLADSPSEQAQQILEMVRDEERAAERQRREKMKLGGLIWSVVGVGLTVLLAAMMPHTGAWAVGLVPLLIGLALQVYVYMLAPRPTA